jgi:nicotinate-nucleotide pyrophosphorylase (carboxylating)
MIPEFGELQRQNALRLIDLAMSEDLGVEGDVTTQLTIPSDAKGAARFVARQAGVVAGLPIVAMLAERVGLVFRTADDVRDGAVVQAGEELARVEGLMWDLLGIERIALNFVQRLSGVASLTARYVTEIQGTSATIFDTRKTTPGWRALEKYAVTCGGGSNHRYGLNDAVLIKDNHLAALSGAANPVGLAVELARKGARPGMIVEIEVDTLEQFRLALAANPDIILLDNLGPDQLAEAVRLRNSLARGVQLEASGGIALGTVRALAMAGVDRISVGALTHSAPALDVGLDYFEEKR